MVIAIYFFMSFSFFVNPVFSQETKEIEILDEKVKTFLEYQRGKWVDWNVPASDGKVLYDLIIKNNYTKAIEIGTSTGHSAIWMAWALSKTGGKLITIEIDEDRHRTALENFQQAGLSKFIDARLADAHELVKELKGPFDFVFFWWFTEYALSAKTALSTRWESYWKK